MKKKKYNGFLRIAMILLALTILIVVALILYKYYGKTFTGKVIYEEYENPNKNCFFKIKGETISMYDCSTNDDCIAKLSQFKNEEFVKKNYPPADVEILGCI